MFTAHFVYWLLREKPQGYEQFLDKIVKAYEACWVENGGFNRTPEGWTKGFLNQNDDYFGIAFVDKKLRGAGYNTDWSGRCLKVMKDNWGALNNVQPGRWTPKSFLARMPQLTVTLKLSANERPSLWGLAYWLLWLFTSLTRGNRDSAIKSWLAGHCALGVSPRLDSVVKLFLTLWKKKHGGVGKREYFKLEHPVRKLMWEWV